MGTNNDNRHAEEIKHNTEHISMEKATERPWKLGDSKKDGMSFTRQIETSLMGHCSIGYTEAPSGSEVMIKRSEANAALIVRAVNSYEALIEAVEEAFTVIGEGMIDNCLTEEELPVYKALMTKLETALKLAKGA